MASEHHDPIDGFLADADALLAEPSALKGLAHRLQADDVPTGTVRWRIERTEPEQYREERITERRDGFWFEAVPVVFEDGHNERLDEVLCVGPWDTLRSAIEWHPETLTVTGEDAVDVADLPDRLLVEFLEGDEWEVYLPSGPWRIGGNVAIPDHATAIAAWSNGDDYEVPGGDRTYCLFRFDDLYVADADGELSPFGNFDSQDKAVREWVDWYLSDDLDPLDTIVKRFSDVLGDQYPQDDVAAAVHEVVRNEFPVDPVCELGGKSLYPASAAEAWWDNEGFSAAEEILEGLIEERDEEA